MSAPQIKSYHCDICPTSFARSEHLQRHRRTHTREKPYQCQRCPTRFSRTDLLRRHGIAQHGLGQDDGTPGGLSSRSSRQQRLKIACDNCNLRKLKCDTERPCRRCRTRQIECISSRAAPAGQSSGNVPDVNATHDVVVPASDRQATAGDCDTYSAPLGLTPMHGRDDTFRSSGLSMLAHVAQRGHHRNGPDMGSSPIERPGGTYGHPTPNHGATTGSEPSQYPGRSVHFNLDQVPSSDVPRWHAETELPQPAQLDLNLGDPSQADSWMNIPMISGNFQEHYIDILQNTGSPYGVFSSHNLFENICPDSSGPMWTDSVEESLFALQGSLTDSPAATTAENTHSGRGGQDEDARSRLQALSEVHPSRPPSPGHQQERNQWLASLGREDPSAAVMRDDRVIIDEFIRLFQARAANWFSCFRGGAIFITKKTRREWYLAMAAVGGLYCSVEGSKRIARWLYHCARQQLFSYVYRDKESSSSSSFNGVSVIETYILLQLFGYLSGDKRAFELTEALHCQTMQAAEELYLFEPAGFEDEDKRASLLESLLILDCYRVVMLQRPPAMPLFRGLRSVFDGSDDEEQTFGAGIEALTSSKPQTLTLTSAVESYKALCAIGVYSWDTVGAHGPRRMLWSSQSCESALDQWVHAHDSSPSPSFMLLFHALQVNMLVCWATVQNAIVEYLDDAGRPHPNSDRLRRPLSSKKQFDRSSLKNIFLHSQDRPKARWHARQILQQARSGQGSGAGAPNSTSNTDTLAREHQNGWEYSEAPHSSFCVCLVTLVLWCDEMLTVDNNEHATKKWLESGLGILQSNPETSCGIKSLFESIISDLLACVG